MKKNDQMEMQNTKWLLDQKLDIVQEIIEGKKTN